MNVCVNWLTCVSLRSPSPQEIHVRKSVGSWFQTKPAQQTDVRNSSRSEKTENLTNKHLFLAGSLMHGLTTLLLDKKRVSTKYQSVSNELMAWHPNLWQRTAQVIGLGIPAEMNAISLSNKKSFCSPQNAETMNVEVKPCCSFVQRPFFSFCQTKWVIIDQLLFQIMKLIWQRNTT